MTTLKEHFAPLLEKRAWWTFAVWFGINAIISLGFTIAWIMTGAFNDVLNLFIQGFICALISSITWIGLMYGTVGGKKQNGKQMEKRKERTPLANRHASKTSS